MMDILKLIRCKVLCALGGMLVMTLLICGLFAVMHAAALFAFWGDLPSPFPWLLLRFFLFLGWLIGGGIGLLGKCASTSEDPIQ